MRTNRSARPPLHKRVSTAADAWKLALWSDWLVAAVTVTAHVLLVLRFEWLDPWPPVTSSTLATALGLLAQLGAALFAFLLTAAVFFYGMERGARRRKVDRSLGDRLWAAWRGAIRSSLLVVFAAYLNSIVAGDWSWGVAEALLVLLVLRTLRVVEWVFDFLRLEEADRVDPGPRTVSMDPPKSRVS